MVDGEQEEPRGTPGPRASGRNGLRAGGGRKLRSHAAYGGSIPGISGRNISTVIILLTKKPIRPSQNSLHSPWQPK